jgi:hypothetical protein
MLHILRATAQFLHGMLILRAAIRQNDVEKVINIFENFKTHARFSLKLENGKHVIIN